MNAPNITKYEKPFHILFMLTAALVTVLGLVLIGQGQAESDTLWHIKAGEWAIENGIPHTDPFSWTMRGEEWFAHEWLWEILAAKIYSSLGSTGIWLFTCFWAAIFSSTLWVLLRRKCSLPRATLLYTFVIISSSAYWTARPHPMAQALFALTIFILLSCKDKPKLLFSLPLISIIWGNMHGSAPLLVLLAFFYWVTATAGIKFKYRGHSSKRCVPYPLNRLNVSVDKLPTQTARLLGFAVIASFVAGLFNPHGIHLWSYMWNVSGNPLMTQYIMEWQSPNFREIIFWPIAILSLCLFCLLVVKRESENNRISLFEFLLMCGFFFLALQQRRHAPYFYFIAALIIGSFLNHGANQPAQFPARVKAGLAALAAIVFISLAWLKPPDWIEEKGYFPIAATDYLTQHELVDGLFNHYDYGGYLIWRGISPFIDGRADLYTFGSDIFTDYISLTSGNASSDGLKTKPFPQLYLDKYGIQTTLIQSGSRLDLYLANHPEWDEVFRDDQSVIYTRQEYESGSSPLG